MMIMNKNLRHLNRSNMKVLMKMRFCQKVSNKISYRSRNYVFIYRKIQKTS